MLTCILCDTPTTAEQALYRVERRCICRPCGVSVARSFHIDEHAARQLIRSAIKRQREQA